MGRVTRCMHRLRQLYWHQTIAHASSTDLIDHAKKAAESCSTGDCFPLLACEHHHSVLVPGWRRRAVWRLVISGFPRFDFA